MLLLRRKLLLGGCSHQGGNGLSLLGNGLDLPTAQFNSWYSLFALFMVYLHYIPISLPSCFLVTILFLFLLIFFVDVRTYTFLSMFF